MVSPSRFSVFLLFGSLSLLSAFLLFQVQPVISKVLLPWFGGSPGVWTTCMLFFQIVLFAGYAYAHALTRLAKKWQWVIHGILILAAVACLPIEPDAAWKPTGTEEPVWRILGLLTATLALPYFVLSSTSPLIQVWYGEANGQAPWRLYAVSNIGSLAALLTFPFVIEPRWDVNQQIDGWSLGFVCFALLLFGVLMQNRKQSAHLKVPTAEEPLPETTEWRPSWYRRLAWLLLPALASLMLLATTNHVCQDVAVIPFLWVVPMSLYLLTFIICFEHERWYRWLPWAGLAGIALILAAGYDHIGDGLRGNLVVTRFAKSMGWTSQLVDFELAPDFRYELIYSFGAMFLACMVCHGELVRLKPPPRRLTEFYLFMSAGGALGGLFAGLLAPRIFTAYLEWPLGLVLAFALCVRITWRWAWRLRIRMVRAVTILLSTAAAVAGFGFIMRWGFTLPNRIERVRNFYGALSVEAGTDDSSGDAIRTLHHGGIIHGLQLQGGKYQAEPLTYYGRNTGVGLALATLKKNPDARVGVVGMGTGTVACYGQAGHVFRFYEINPEVERLARKHFTFLQDLENRGGTVEVVLGDARLTLDRETESQQFDVLLLDAFSGDSVPVHLLTLEAFEIYRRHMKPDGIIAVHVTNRYLLITPVIQKIAAHLKMESRHIGTVQDWLDDYTDYVMVTNNQPFLALNPDEPLDKKDQIQVPVWTDQNANLFQILKRE